jgi:transketolase
MGRATAEEILEIASKLSAQSRIEILGMTHKAGASHVGSALSIIDVLALLYSGQFDLLRDSPELTPNDTFILSKGHAAAAIYAVLFLKGKISRSDLDDYCADGALLGGHVSHNNVSGVELSTGSLGHGLPYGVGIALAKKMKGQSGLVFVVISDGECDEGTTWESALIANQFDLGNLVVIVDRNGLQSLASTEETIALEPLSEKWYSFGWNCRKIDGHNQSDLLEAIESTRNTEKPTCIIAETTKGKGVSFMENTVKWHYKSPNLEEYQQAIEEIKGGSLEK